MNYRFCILFIVTVLITSCNRTKQQTFKIGFSQCCDDSWRDVMNNEMQRELAFYSDIQFDLKVADNNSLTQVEQIKALQEQGIDLLIVSPNEAEPLTPIIEAVYEARIPVILIDRKVNSKKYTAFIGGDNYEIGKTAADYIASKISSGKIIEIQHSMTMSPAFYRNKGFTEAVN